MALTIRGKSRCHICGQTILIGERVQMFPPGLFGPKSGFAHLDDSGVHWQCLTSLPGASEALTVLDAYLAKMKGEGD